MINNWLTTNLRNPRHKSHLVDFVVTVENPYRFRAMSLVDAAKEAVVHAASSMSPLYVALSGGLDSEYALHVCLEAGVPVTPILVKHPGNATESAFAERFCDERGVAPCILTVTEEEMMATWYADIYDSFYGRGFYSAAGLIAMKYAQRHGGHLLTGDCPPLDDFKIAEMDTPMTGIVSLAEWDFYIGSQGLLSSYPHVGGLFAYSMEVFYAYLNEIDTGMGVQRAKAKMYGLELRPKMFPTPSKESTASAVYAMKMERRTQAVYEVGTIRDVRQRMATWLV